MGFHRIEDVDQYFQPILERIGAWYDTPLVVDRYDEEWVQFHLVGLLDQQVIVTLETNNSRILIGNEQREFQILCAWDPAAGKGLWLHYLEDAQAKGEYRSGVWFY